MNSRKPRIASPGLWLLGIGVLHNLIGALIAGRVVPDPGLEKHAGSRNLLWELGSQGLQGDGALDPLRLAFFWFLFFGLALMLCGLAVRSLEHRDVPISSSFAYGLLLLGGLGALQMPASGFWLVLIPFLLILRQKEALAPVELASPAAR